MKGFVVWDYQSAFNDALAKLTQWYRQGALPSRVSVAQGFEQLPRALRGLFGGENVGKQLVKASSALPPVRAGETRSAEPALS